MAELVRDAPVDANIRADARSFQEEIRPGDRNEASELKQSAEDENG